MCETKDMLLMMKDTPVMAINFELGKYDVLSKELIPFSLQNLLYEIPTYDSFEEYKLNSMRISNMMCENHSYFVYWLADRMLPIYRSNAKKLHYVFKFEQVQSEYYRAKKVLEFRALSLLDNYWIKLDDDEFTWKDVNLHNAQINKSIAKVALCGSSYYTEDSAAEALRCPELSGQGSFAKAWLRDGDDLYLHKRGSKDTSESKIEVMVSKLLDNCNVRHVTYEAARAFRYYTCKCKCMTDDTLSILTWRDFKLYCHNLGKDPKCEALRIDAEMIYKMMIVDYLIANPDRHDLNWGFFYNCETMKILGCHPLFDHNLAFNTECMKDPDRGYLFDDSKSMRDWAKYAMKKVDFHFYREFTREDFLTDRQYECFTQRAKEIGVRVIPKQI